MESYTPKQITNTNPVIPKTDITIELERYNTTNKNINTPTQNINTEIDFSDMFDNVYETPIIENQPTTYVNVPNQNNIETLNTEPISSNVTNQPINIEEPMIEEYEQLIEKIPDKEYLEKFENAEFTLNGQRQNPTLLSPTQAVKYGDIYFVANTFSTYQNKIMYSYDQVNWLTIDPPADVDFKEPHSVAFDGKNLVITDTENKRMLLYEYQDGEFKHTKSFNDNGLDPRFHYVTYNEETDTYYGVASEFQDCTRLYEFKIQDGEFVSTDGTPLVGKEIKDVNGGNYVDEFNSTYARSLTLDGDQILMPVHNQLKQSEILVMDKDMNTKKTIKVPDEIGGVTCIKEINGYYVLTSLTDKNGEKVNAMCVAKNLEDFENGTYQKVDPSVYYGDSNPDAAPYFIEYYDDRFWITVNGGPPVCTIDVDNNGNVSVNDSHVR